MAVEIIILTLLLQGSTRENHEPELRCRWRQNLRILGGRNPLPGGIIVLDFLSAYSTFKYRDGNSGEKEIKKGDRNEMLNKSSDLNSYSTGAPFSDFTYSPSTVLM